MILLLALACSEPTSAVFLEGFGYGWEDFNHRVSHIEVRATGSGAEAAIVGGTSTSGVGTDLPDGCDPSTCKEFPFSDTAVMDVLSVDLTSTDVVLASGGVSLVTVASGSAVEVAVPLPRRASGDVGAVLAGVRWSTDLPLALDDADGVPQVCYDPSFGWHPRRLAVSASDARLAEDGLSVLVTVVASFEAGESLESVRECVDAVNTYAQVDLGVDLVVAVGDGLVSESFSNAGAWGLDDEGDSPPQLAPDLFDAPLPADAAGHAFGWSEVDFSFHGSDPDGRGAYLRTLHVVADAAAGGAAGWATNETPGALLSGFEYTFEGTLVGIPGTPTRRRAEAVSIPVEIGDDGIPVLQGL